MSYRCSCCGEIHNDLPDLGFDKPFYVQDIPDDEQSRRLEMTSDTCILDGEHFFIRGIIEIPIHDYPEKFGLGVWVSQKEENFWSYVNNFNSSEIGPYFGWLSNEINYSGESILSLKTMAHFRGQGMRPAIVIEPTEHPLAIDQRDGISLDRAWEIVHQYIG